MGRLVGVMATMLMSGCNPGYGANCQTIPLGSPLAGYPHGEVRPLTKADFQWPARFVDATAELESCSGELAFGATCDALVERLRLTQLSGRYVDEPCNGGGRQGVTTFCAAFVDERDRIVGLKNFCAD